MKNRLLRLWNEWRGTVLLFAIILPFKSVIADFNPVPTGSMNPTILEGDLVLSNKLAYSLKVPFTLNHIIRWANPKAGDIVICFSPEDHTRLVKRIIGAPGDRIEMRNKHLYINGKMLDYTIPESDYKSTISQQFRDYSYFAEEHLGGKKHPVMGLKVLTKDTDFKEIHLGEDEYFIMGDNRDNSKDSRSFGIVKNKSIVGKAEAVIASLDINDTFLPRIHRFFTRL